MSAALNDNQRRDMAIECKRCGGPTMPETVIKLRRGVLGFRGIPGTSRRPRPHNLARVLEPAVSARPGLLLGQMAAAGRPGQGRVPARI